MKSCPCSPAPLIVKSGTAQLAQNGIRLIFVTLGANGVFYRFGDKTGHVAGVPLQGG